MRIPANRKAMITSTEEEIRFCRQARKITPRVPITRIPRAEHTLLIPFDRCGEPQLIAELVCIVAQAGEPPLRHLECNCCHTHIDF